jgi:hypothetical protein
VQHSTAQQREGKNELQGRHYGWCQQSAAIRAVTIDASGGQMIGRTIF